jgi:Na+/melibiose symporter-like transporter
MLNEFLDALSQPTSRAGSHWIVLLPFFGPIFLAAICMMEFKGKKRWFIASIVLILAGYLTNLFLGHTLVLFIVSGVLFWVMLFSFMRDRASQYNN